MTSNKENSKTATFLQRAFSTQRKLRETESRCLRDPLADLSRNVKEGPKQSRNSFLSKQKTSNEKRRAEANSKCTKARADEKDSTKSQEPTGTTNQKVLEEHTKLRVNDKVTVRDKSATAGSSDVFVDATEHFDTFFSNNCPAPNGEYFKEVGLPLRKTLPVVRRSVNVHEKFQNKEHTKDAKPAQKTKLIKKLSSRSKCSTTISIFSDYMYDEDYYQDNFKYMIATEKGFVLRMSVLKRIEDLEARRNVINWLAYASQVLHLQESTMFAAVRMFDTILVTAPSVPVNRYALIIITCLWILSKMFHNKSVKISKLFNLCDGKYSKEQFIYYEKKLLRQLNFQVNIPEPETYLNYFLKAHGIEHNNKLRTASLFVIECWMFFPEFSCSAPSLLASSALHIVLTKLHVDHELFLKSVHDNLLDADTFKNFANHMTGLLKQALQLRNNEVAMKYSCADKFEVSNLFAS